MEVFFFLRITLPAETFMDSTFVAMADLLSSDRARQKSQGGAYCASLANDQKGLLTEGGDVFVHHLLGLGVGLIKRSLDVCHISGQIGINHRTKLVP